MWLDTAGAYWTLSNEYIESVWWLFRRIWDAGAIYEGFKVVPYCGRCGTALSSHELGQPGAYRDVTEPSVYVRFPLVGRDDSDLLVWTTTPWTLPSNVGAAVGPAIDYVRVRAPEGGRDLVMARARVADVLGADAEIVGRRARRLPRRRALRAAVHAARRPRASARTPSWPTTSSRSTTARASCTSRPRSARSTARSASAKGCPIVNPVNDAARFDAVVGEQYAGRFVKDADPDLIDDLTARGKLVAVVDYTHSYPHCWRCDTPLIYWAKPEWFARTSAYKAELLAENETINWYPGPHQARALRRLAREQRRLGALPRPLLGHADPRVALPRLRPRHLHRFGRRARASSSGRDLDRHGPAPAVRRRRHDRAAPRAGPAPRTGSSPCSTRGSTRGRCPPRSSTTRSRTPTRSPTRFPADFICEAIDQTRGWFYSLLAVNTLAFGPTPYRNVVCLAHIVDKDGVKMSKSRGNVIDPVPVLAERGADALRWYMFSSGSPWTPKRVYVEGIDEATRQFLLTLWNTYSFFVTYANIDGWTPGAPDAGAEPVHVLDRWITSRVHRTVRTATESLEAFDALAATQALAELVDDLSNWYVRRSRPRFWKSSDPAAHATLHRALLTLSQLLAPFCPFVADELFRNLAGTDESVHLSDWPALRRRPRSTTRSKRRWRWPARSSRSAAPRAPTPSSVCANRSPARSRSLTAGEQLRDDVAQEIKDELNVKQLEVVDSLEGLLSYRVVPNFRTLGPRLGKLAPRVKALLERRRRRRGARARSTSTARTRSTSTART